MDTSRIAFAGNRTTRTLGGDLGDLIRFVGEGRRMLDGLWSQTLDQFFSTLAERPTADGIPVDVPNERPATQSRALPEGNTPFVSTGASAALLLCGATLERPRRTIIGARRRRPEVLQLS